MRAMTVESSSLGSTSARYFKAERTATAPSILSADVYA